MLQHFNLATLQHCNIATLQLCNIAILQLCNIATLHHRNIATLQLCNFVTLQLCNIANLQLYNIAGLLDRPAGRTTWPAQLDGPAGWTSWTDSWMDQLDGPAGWISWMDQFSSFEASASSLIQRLTFQFVHCHSFRVRRRPCFLSHILYPSSHLPEYHVPYPISIIPYSLGAIWQVEKNFKVNY